jgi:hypothetical protein
MLVHDRFVFIHNQKCGGVFVRELLERELGAKALEEPLPFRHVGWRQIPAAAADRPVLCYVRNPWDWYVSWYEFKRQHPAVGGDPLFEQLSDNGRYDFPRTVAKACAGEEAITDHTDLYTGSFSYSVGGVSPELLTVGRFESLVDDLERFLAAAGVALPDGAIARARTSGPANATRRRPYREYYDEDLREVVGDSCRELIDRFGYSF